MKKMFISLLLVACMITPVSAEDNSARIAEIESRIEELNQELTDLNAELKELRGIEGFTCEMAGFTYAYLKNEVIEQNGDEFAVLYFDFTNNSGENSAASWALNMQAFQDGVQLDSYILFMTGDDDREKALENAGKQVQDGTTIEVAMAFKITSRNDITLDIGEMYPWEPEEFTVVLEG